MFLLSVLDEAALFVDRHKCYLPRLANSRRFYIFLSFAPARKRNKKKPRQLIDIRLLASAGETYEMKEKRLHH